MVGIAAAVFMVWPAWEKVAILSNRNANVITPRKGRGGTAARAPRKLSAIASLLNSARADTGNPLKEDMDLIHARLEGPGRTSRLQYRHIVTDRFGIVTGHFGDVIDEQLIPA
ncbi:MAG TPA: hypothetical protein VIM34_04740 [Burkholderiaceae bacterium]